MKTHVNSKSLHPNTPGHADRAGPLRDYCLGLIMPCERKSVDPMAAVTAPDRTAARQRFMIRSRRWVG